MKEIKFFFHLILVTLINLTFLNFRSVYAMTFNELTDVPEGHWARNAIQELIDKYNIMEGFPDKTFKGTKQISRYEAAAAFYKIMLKIEEISRNMTISEEDLRLIKSLKLEFQNELDSIRKLNIAQDERIAKLEKELEKVKSKIGEIKFGGYMDLSIKDKMQDDFRPGYNAGFGLSWDISAGDNASIDASIDSWFGSSQEKGKEWKPGQAFSEKTDTGIELGGVCYTYKLKGFLSPKFVVGYASIGRLVQPWTRVPNAFGNRDVGAAGPNLLSSKHGIRLTKSVIAGVSISEGPLGLSFGTSPDIFYGQLKVDTGWMRLVLVGETDQTNFIGTPVLDPMHNETIVLDFGNENIGISFQATARGLAEKFDFKAASGLLNLSMWDFSLGGGVRFENVSEKNIQQMFVGGYFTTPSKWGDINIPSLTVCMQEPLTLIGGQFYEESKLGDNAGMFFQLKYDNPIIPDLTIQYSQNCKILFSSYPEDINTDTISVSTSFGF